MALKATEKVIKHASNEEFFSAATNALARAMLRSDRATLHDDYWDSLPAPQRLRYLARAVDFVRSLRDADLLPQLLPDELEQAPLSMDELREIHTEPASRTLTSVELSAMAAELLEARTAMSYNSSGYRHLIRRIDSVQIVMDAAKKGQADAVAALERVQNRYIDGIRDAMARAHKRDADRIQELQDQLAEWQEIASDRLNLARTRQQRIRELEEQTIGQRAVVDATLEHGLREILGGDA